MSFDRQNLQPFGSEIWLADGPVASFYGFPYSTRMAVIRLSDGSLFVWSPVALSTPLRAAVDALGPVRHLVSPNALHHLFLAEWTSAYPEARLYASPRLRRKRRDLSFNAELGDAPESAWAGDIDQVVLHGSFALTEIVFFHRHSRTALFAYLIQNFPRDWFKGWRGGVARLGGIVAPHPSAPSDWRLSFVYRRRRARHSRACSRGRSSGWLSPMAYCRPRVARPSCGAPSPGCSGVIGEPNSRVTINILCLRSPWRAALSAQDRNGTGRKVEMTPRCGRFGGGWARSPQRSAAPDRRPMLGT